MELSDIEQYKYNTEVYYKPSGYEQWSFLARRGSFAQQRSILLKRPTEDQLKRMATWFNNEFRTPATADHIKTLRQSFDAPVLGRFEVKNSKNLRRYALNTVKTNRVCIGLGVWFSLDIINELLTLPVDYTIIESADTKQLTRSFN